jgi:hypothetical protein
VGTEQGRGQSRKGNPQAPMANKFKVTVPPLKECEAYGCWAITVAVKHKPTSVVSGWKKLSPKGKEKTSLRF